MTDKLATWQLHGTLLTPTTAHLQAHTVRLLNETLPDTILTFQFPNRRTLTFHKSYLANASPPLNTLVSGPFIEATTKLINLRYETYQAFQVIRNFLYLLPIDMIALSPDIALVADRWGLHDLFHAYLLFIRSYTWPSVAHFIHACLPLMHLPTLPSAFKRSVAIKLATNLHDLQAWIHVQRTPSRTTHATDEAPYRASEHSQKLQGPRSSKITRSEYALSCRASSYLTAFEQCRYKQTVLWQALHKQRMISMLLNYLRATHQKSNYNYYAFVTHGLSSVLNGMTTQNSIVKIMSRGLKPYVPRELSQSGRDSVKWDGDVHSVMCTDNDRSSLRMEFAKFVDNVMCQPSYVYIFSGREVFSMRFVMFRTVSLNGLTSLLNNANTLKSAPLSDRGD